MINKRTEALLESFVNKPVGSLIIEGRQGSGADDALTQLAKKLLGELYPSKLHRFTSEEGKAIGIDTTREVKSLLSTKADRSSGISRIITIDGAERMTREAQNALLKIIEEPTDRSLLVLTTEDSSLLLPTIRSRCQIVPVLPISKTQATSSAGDKSESQVNKAFIASGGMSELFTELLQGENIAGLQEGKEFLSQSPFERLKNAKSYDNKERITELLRNLTVIAEAGLRSSNHAALQRWRSIAEDLTRIRKQLDSNGSAKLAYLRLAVVV